MTIGGAGEGEGEQVLSYMIISLVMAHTSVHSHLFPTKSLVTFALFLVLSFSLVNNLCSCTEE